MKDATMATLSLIALSGTLFLIGITQSLAHDAHDSTSCKVVISFYEQRIAELQGQLAEVDPLLAELEASAGERTSELSQQRMVNSALSKELITCRSRIESSKPGAE